MKKIKYSSFEELPLTLTVADISSVLGIGRNSAYQLVHSGIMRVFKIGKQIRVPKDEVMNLIYRQSGDQFNSQYITDTEQSKIELSKNENENIEHWLNILRSTLDARR